MILVKSYFGCPSHRRLITERPKGKKYTLPAKDYVCVLSVSNITTSIIDKCFFSTCKIVSLIRKKNPEIKKHSNLTFISRFRN